jgi:hypothetical protein
MAPADERVIIVVMAEGHGNRTQAQILAEKQQDICTLGRTYWYGRATTIYPLDMRGREPLQVYIIEQAKPHPGDQSTFDTFTRWSLDNRTWQLFPSQLNPVTGSARGVVWAMVLDQLEPQEDQFLDLWHYSDQEGSAIRFSQSEYAVYARMTPSQEQGMVSHIRRIIAVGRLCDPNIVYIGT